MYRPVDKLLTVISIEEGACIHLIDVENLVGAGLVTPEAVSHLCAKYLQRVSPSKSDLFLVAAGPQNANAAREGWRAGQTFFQFRKGKDGADTALVSFFNQIENLKMFKAVYVASGDHSFEPIAQVCISQGVPVTFVTGRGKMSRTLAIYRHLKVQGL